MKTFSIKELKAELATLSPHELAELCLRLARYKKENKELLAYLLFNAGDEAGYISEVKSQMEEQFAAINHSNVYLTKKMLRKILRGTNRYIKYSGSKQMEVELLISFLKMMKQAHIPFRENKTLENIYHRLIKRIQKAMSSLHEDLQYDYNEELKPLL